MSNSLEMNQINFGAPDAETEITIDEGSFLTSVFFDPFNAMNQIKNGKFVISGRKGTGKSEFIYYLDANKSAEHFVTILRYKRFESEKIIGMLDKDFNSSSLSLLWKWIMLCALTELMAQDQSIAFNSDAKRALDTVRKRITGFATLDGFQVTEVIKQRSSTFGLHPLKELCNFSKSNAIETKETSLNILQLVPHYEQLIKDLFKSKRNKSNCYFICIDDLDEEYSGSPSDKQNLITLIKVAKELHTSLNQLGINFFPVISIRTDILEAISGADANFHKILSANTQQFTWYNHANFKDDSDSVPLKKLIVERVNKSYRKFKKPLPNDVFNSLFSENLSNKGIENFKYILDGTLYRPRDLIQIFNIIKEQFPNRVSISRDEYSRIYKQDYSPKKINEWQSELLAFFSQNTISGIFDSLKTLARQGDLLDFKDFQTTLKNNNVEYDADYVCKQLYQAGLICNVAERDKRRYNWVYRTDYDDDAQFYPDHKITLHTAVKEKYKKNSIFR